MEFERWKSIQAINAIIKNNDMFDDKIYIVNRIINVMLSTTY